MDSKVFELNQSNNQQSSSNTQAYSNNMFPIAPPFPSNPSHENNMHPNHHSEIQVATNLPDGAFSSIGCSVFNLICCSFCLGIPAVIFSCKAYDNFNTGRFAEAKSDAKIAKILNIIGVCMGSVELVLLIIYLIVLFTVIRE
jgi:hypothetical protein